LLLTSINIGRGKKTCAAIATHGYYGSAAMPIDWVPVQNADSHGDLLLMMMGQKPNCNPSYMEELISNAQGLIERGGAHFF